MIPIDLQDEFTSRYLDSIVFEESGCWKFNKWLDRGGYGRISLKGKVLKAHRLMYYMCFGKFDENLFVCHSCDNTSCVNPTHLFLGFPKDNSKDMVTKGRQALGIKSGMSKLTSEDVIEIRKLYSEGFSGRQLARKFKVGWPNIFNIVNRKTWRHL